MTAGKNLLSFRKQNSLSKNNTAIGFKKLHFKHQATFGDTGINLSSIVLPTGSSYVNPSSAELLNAGIFNYKKNITITSTFRGILMEEISYEVVSSSRIDFVGFTAEDNEVFNVTVDYVAFSGREILEGSPLNVSGDLAVGVTDFNVGKLFEIGKYPDNQMGAVLVFRNGLIQTRNSGNSSTVLDGNYYEVDNGSGSGQIIRFNNAPSGQSDAIIVVGNGMFVYSFDNSALQTIENLSSKIDSIIPTVAELADVPESSFGGVSNSDLKSFGDLVINILSAQVPIKTTWEGFTPVFTYAPSYNILQPFRWMRDGSRLLLEGMVQFTGTGPASIVNLALPAALNGIAFFNSDNYAAGFATTYAIASDSGFSVCGVRAVGTHFEFMDNDSGSTLSGSNINNGNIISIKVDVRINGWNETQTIKEQLGL